MEERLILRLGSEMYTIRREYPVVPESNEVLKKKKKKKKPIHPQCWGVGVSEGTGTRRKSSQ